LKRLVIVSNRLPISIEKKRGKITYKASMGGLATGLDSIKDSYDSLWVGWPGIPMDRIQRDMKSIKKTLKKDFGNHPVFLSKNQIKKFYEGFSNETIWPLFHYFTQYVKYDRDMWDSYVSVNRLYCDTVLSVAKPDDIIWVHDYHLMLLPKMIRDKRPDATIGFFLHIPFPSFEIFRQLPWRQEILEGILGADLVGFHTYDYERHFLSSVRRIMGIEPWINQLLFKNRLIKVDQFPIGIDYHKFSTMPGDPVVQEKIEDIRNRVGERRIILSQDRLDYTKGIIQRLEAYDLFLQRNPDFKEKVTLIFVAVPSRTDVPDYENLKKTVDGLVGKIEGRHGTFGWSPIWYLYRALPFEELIALYRTADVAMVTPVRDGMNLIAKEYLATKVTGEGVLILSEMAGAAHELGEAITINPNSKEDIVRALTEALNMPYNEQLRRNRIMQKRLQTYDIKLWAKDFTYKLESVKNEQKMRRTNALDDNTRNRLVRDYVKAKRRLILLDYDGTLIPFFKNPEEARPNQGIKRLIKDLSGIDGNHVVIISGRDRHTLNRWFGRIDVSLVAEHGVWLKEPGKEWRTVQELSDDWKNEIRAVIEFSAQRTAGTFVEEKDYSLVWHYRKADPELAQIRGRELMDNLMDLTKNLDLTVTEGNKIIEVRSAGINKGKAAQMWVNKDRPGFILAIGDDVTDEDTFEALPDQAYTIKVGFGNTEARLKLNSTKEVRALLKQLVRSG